MAHFTSDLRPDFIVGFRVRLRSRFWKRDLYCLESLSVFGNDDEIKLVDKNLEDDYPMGSHGE